MMNKVLVTGGTGVLGRALVPRLAAAGFQVRIMSRRSPEPGEADGFEWARADLESGEGLAAAVADLQAIVHAATSPVKRKVDLGGTKRLLEASQGAGVEHFVYISIVGIDKINFSYYRTKLAAERLIQAGSVPWTILRAVQFHNLVDMALRGLTRLPWALIPTDLQVQPISAEETADQLVLAVERGPSGRLPDIGGPEVLRVGEMTRLWLAAQGLRRKIIHIPFPGGFAAGFRRGLNTTPEHKVGKITWAEWLESEYGAQRSSFSRTGKPAGEEAPS